MNLPEPIATKLEVAIAKCLKASGLQEVDIGKELANISRTGFAVAVGKGRFRRDGGHLAHGMDVVIDVIVKNVRADGEVHRRKEAHALVLAIMHALMNQTFDLDIQPLDPGPWVEVTSGHELAASLLHIEVSLSTDCDEDPITADDTAAALRELVASFYLPDSVTGELPPVPAVAADITFPLES